MKNLFPCSRSLSTPRNESTSEAPLCRRRKELRENDEAQIVIIMAFMDVMVVGKLSKLSTSVKAKKRDRNLRFFVAPVGILPEASSSSPQDALYFSAVKAQSKYNGGGKFLVDGCSLKL